MVKYLVKDLKCDINARANDGNTALMVACERGHEGIVKFLVGFEEVDYLVVDNEGFTAFDNSIVYGNFEIAKILY